MAGWWESAPVVDPASDPSFTGFIPGTPKAPNVPANYEPDPDHPGAVRPIKGGPADPTAGQSAEASDLTGPAYLGTLDKPTAALVQALAEGRKAFPSGAALRNPYWQNMLTHVSNYDPGFDETTYTSRAATRRDFNIGTAGKNIRALNTAIGHLGHLYEQAGDTASHGFKPLNVAENAARVNLLGDAGPTNYASTTSALAGELTAVYRGAGGAEADIKRYIDELSPNASEAQKRGTISNIANLLNSRLEALQDQYKKGMGVGANMQFLDPHAEQVLKSLQSGTPPTANPAAPPPSIPPVPPGGGGGGGDKETTIGVGELTDPQKASYKEFWASNPNATPEQLTSFFAGMGLNVSNADEIIKARQKGGHYSDVTLNTTYRDKLAQRLKQEDALGVGDGAATTLVTQGGTANLSDEAAGVGNAAANILTSPLTGKFDPVSAYKFGRDAERLRIENARKQLGYGGGALEFAAGLATAAPSAALATVTPKVAARAAAGAGALAGFGAGEGVEQSATGAGIGALTGYGVARASPYVASKVANRFSGGGGMAPELAAAAEAEGVDLYKPMVDPTTRAKFGALESDPSAQPTIRAAVENTRGQIEDRAAALGGGGQRLEPEVAGERLQVAGNRYINRSRGIANRLYQRASNLSGGAAVTPTNAVARVDAELAELQASPNTNAAEISFMQGLREDLTRAPMSVDTIRNLRTSLRGQIGTQNLTMTQAEARASRVMDAAAQDIEAAVPPEAARAYRRADGFYRERQSVVDDLKKAILGRRNDQLDPQQAFKNLKSLTSPGANGRRLSAVMRTLEPDERQDIAATVAHTLGRTGTNEPFSAATFLSQTKGLSQSTLRTVFGPDGAQSVSNLRELSRALRDAGGDINRSRSTTVANRASALKNAARTFVMSLTGLGGYEAAGIGGALTGAGVASAAMGANAGLKVLSARAMVNPRVSAWLARAANVSTRAQAENAVRQLGTIIGREPALATELQPIYASLQQRLASPLAAQPQAEGQQNEQ